MLIIAREYGSRWCVRFLFIVVINYYCRSHKGILDLYYILFVLYCSAQYNARTTHSKEEDRKMEKTDQETKKESCNNVLMGGVGGLYP